VTSILEEYVFLLCCVCILFICFTDLHVLLMLLQILSTKFHVAHSIVLKTFF
jgi:hypothetical protein